MLLPHMAHLHRSQRSPKPFLSRGIEASTTASTPLPQRPPLGFSSGPAPSYARSPPPHGPSSLMNQMMGYCSRLQPTRSSSCSHRSHGYQQAWVQQRQSTASCHRHHHRLRQGPALGRPAPALRLRQRCVDSAQETTGCCRHCEGAKLHEISSAGRCRRFRHSHRLRRPPLPPPRFADFCAHPRQSQSPSSTPHQFWSGGGQRRLGHEFLQPHTPQSVRVSHCHESPGNRFERPRVTSHSNHRSR